MSVTERSVSRRNDIVGNDRAVSRSAANHSVSRSLSSQRSLPALTGLPRIG